MNIKRKTTLRQHSSTRPHPDALRVATAAIGFVCLFILQNPSPAAAADKPAGIGPHLAGAGFVSLFNGRDLSGWEGRPGAWEVRDGAIWSTGSQAKRNWLIWRGGEPGDFELRLRFKYEKGNSGVQVRSREIDPFMVRGYQVEVAAQAKMGLWHHSIAPAKHRSHLATAGQRVHIDEAGEKSVERVAPAAEVQAAFKEGEWNDLTVVADGPRLVQKVNGVVFADLTDNDREHASRSGLIAFQDHGRGTLAGFKDVWLRTTAAASTNKEGAKAKAKILLIGKKPDHPWGTHMYLFTCEMLTRCLAQVDGVETLVSDGWPEDPAVLDGVKAIVIYTSPAAEILLDGPHAAAFERLMAEGVGLVTIHWASTVYKGNLERLGPRWMRYLGATWVSNVGLSTDRSTLKQLLPEHPVCRGWDEYELHDEFYLNPVIAEAQPLLQVTTKGVDVVVGWVHQRPDGGRAFGTTLGHFYRNFQIEPFRRMIANGILWAAHLEVPKDGAPVNLPGEKLALPPRPGR